MATEQNDTVNGDNGVTHWDYQVSADAVNALPTGSVRHEVFDVIVADDQGATATHEVMITINGPPNNAPVIHDIARHGHSYRRCSGSSDAPPSAAVTDADFDNLTMTVHVSHGKITATSAILDAITSGTLTEIDGDGTDGTLVVSGSPSAITAAIQAGLTYTPNHDFNGPDALDVSITDGHGGTASASLTIDVTPVNDAPVATITPVSYSATEQTSLSLKNNGLSISDVDAGSGSLTATLSVGEGTLTVTAGTSGAVVSNSGTSSVTVTGTVAQINALLNTNAHQHGQLQRQQRHAGASTTLTLTVNDNGNTGGGASLGSDTATINITAVNDAPVATITPARYSATEQTSLSLKNNGLSISDVDAGSGSLTATLSVGEGTLTVTAGASGAWSPAAAPPR